RDMTPTPGPGPGPVPDLAPFLQAEAWLGLNPALNVANPKRLGTFNLPTLDDATGNALEALLVREGYFQLPPVDWGLPLEEMARAIARLVGAGLVPPFCFVYDEFWLLFFKLHGLLTRLLGDGYRWLPDFWAWHVAPQAAQSGWRPHRDKGRQALLPDGR